MTLRDRITQFNETVAVKGSMAFGSMATFWLFMTWGILGLLPWLPTKWTNLILLVSSAWIQLAALPLIMVGGVVLNRASEARAAQDHSAILEELALVHEAHDVILEELALAKEERQLLQAINQRLELVLAAKELATLQGIQDQLS